MRLVIRGRSALAALISNHEINRKASGDKRVLRDCFPTKESVAYLESAFPQIPKPYHLLVPTWTRSKRDCKLSTSSFSYRAGSFILVSHGIFATSPELCFVQLGTETSLHEHILFGSALCASFCIDPNAHNGLSKREPLTTVKRIERFIERNSGLAGIRQSRKALPFLIEGGASPPELFLHMVCSLPSHLGGYHLPKGCANRKLHLSTRSSAIAGRKTLIPDYCWPSFHLALEYDSNSEHLTSPQITLDSTKRLALEAEGYKVITVTSQQLAKQTHMRQICLEIARHLGVRIRIRNRGFSAAQRKLYATSFALNGLFNQAWIDEQSTSASEQQGKSQLWR